MELHRRILTIHVVSVCRAGHIHPMPDAHVEVLVLHTNTRGPQVLHPCPPVHLLTAQPSTN